MRHRRVGSRRARNGADSTGGANLGSMVNSTPMTRRALTVCSLAGLVLLLPGLTLAQQRAQPAWQPAPMPLAQPIPLEGSPKRMIAVRPRPAEARTPGTVQPPRPPRPVATLPERQSRPAPVQPAQPVPPRPVDPARATTVTTTVGPDGQPQQTVTRGLPQPAQGAANPTAARAAPLPPGTPPVAVRRAPPPPGSPAGAAPATAMPNGADIARQLLMQGIGLNALTSPGNPSLPRP